MSKVPQNDLLELYALLSYQPRRPAEHHRETRMVKLLAFLRDENGATAIEYGLIAAGIAVAIIAVVNGVGTQLNTTFSSISTQLK
jgi:pilus assembly protein Flp/PilA